MIGEKKYASRKTYTFEVGDQRLSTRLGGGLGIPLAYSSVKELSNSAFAFLPVDC